MVSQSVYKDAVVAFNQRDFEVASRLFDREIALHPDNLKAIEYRGDIECARLRWTEALPYFERLRKLNPNNADYQYKYGGVLGMIAKDSSKFTAMSMLDDIRGAFLRAIALDPKHIGARWALIDYYLEVPGILGGSERKAQRYANELAKLSPVDGYLAKGHIAEYFSRYNQAETFYRSAIAVGRSKTTYERLADLYRKRLKRPDKAREVLLEYQNLKKS